MEHRVIAAELNLRSQPVIRPSTRLATLPQGQLVEKIADASAPGWWKVRTTLSGVAVEGFVSSAFLEPATAAPDTVVGIRAVHLRPSASARRDVAGGRAFPLNEAGQPSRTGGDTTATGGIIDWLDVERSARYAPKAGQTFCNIYAYDYSCLAGTYLPRVWWTRSAMARLGVGESVPVVYGTTVTELNANALMEWFPEFGKTFGWRRTFDLDELQRGATNGGISIIVARRTDPNRSGHIVAIAPESGSRQAQRSNGKVSIPLQSQAGASNVARGTQPGTWWRHMKFASFGFWMHD